MAKSTRPDGLPPKPPRVRRYPVASFGPELMAVLLKGATEPITLKFPNNKQATFFQHRIHTLRASMRIEGHAMAEAVSRTRFRRIWGERLYEHLKGSNPELAETFKNDHKGEKAAYILVQPTDAEFKTILEEAGVKIETPAIDVPDVPGLEGVEVETNTSPFIDPYKDYKGGDT